MVQNNKVFAFGQRFEGMVLILEYVHPKLNKATIVDFHIVYIYNDIFILEVGK